jgi:DNA-binding NarL/FixJ family response regulator
MQSRMKTNKNQGYKIHIAENDKLSVTELSASIKQSNFVSSVQLSYTLQDCNEMIMLDPPDILLLGMDFPDGNTEDFCLSVKKQLSSTKILLLIKYSDYQNYWIIENLLNIGASGYILKNSLTEEVIAGIRHVIGGEIFELDKHTIKPDYHTQSLSARELSLLNMITEGLSNTEIADQLFLSVETIKTYRKNLNLKLRAKNQVDLVRIAFEKNLIDHDLSNQHLIPDATRDFSLNEMKILKLLINNYTQEDITEKLNLTEEEFLRFRNDISLKLNVIIQKAENKPDKESLRNKLGLNVRQMQILELLTKGYSNKGMALRMFLAVSTIESYRKDMLDKIDPRPKNGIDLLNAAYKIGLLDDEDTYTMLLPNPKNEIS